MRKQMLFLAVIALLAISCGSKKTTETTKKVIPQLYYAGENVTISDTAAVFNKKTVQWTVCGTDKKVEGTIYRPAGDTVFSHTVTAQGNPVPADSLTAWAGTTFVADCGNGGVLTSGRTNGFWDWFWPVLATLIGIILLILGVGWLINNWSPTRKNDSSSKTESMNNSVADPNRIAALNAMIATMKGQDGTGKGMVKDGCLEMVVGEAKASVNIRIKNTGSGSVFVGDHIALTNSNNSTGVPAAQPANPAS